MNRGPSFDAVIATMFILCNATSAYARDDRLPGARRVADAIIESQQKASGVPGLSAAVVREGRVLWTGTAGYRDRDRNLPVEPATSFRLASVSKLITATAAMVLFDRGLLDLDAPVQRYAPQLHLSWLPVSARQLAAHIAGVPHYQDIDQNRGGKHFASVSESVGIFAGRNLLFVPGTSYNYSSYGYTLLSAMVEARARAPFLEFVANDITRGLDIRPDLRPDRMHDTIAYEFADGRLVRAPAHDYSYSWGGAGFRGSARDVALFGARVFDAHFLSQPARLAMWTPTRLADGSTVADGGDLVGFGWRIGRDSNDERVVHHAGVAIGARSALIVYPDRAESVSLLSNAIWVSDIKETATMMAMPFHIGAGAKSAACPTRVTRYEGTFADQAISGRASFKIVNGICRGELDAGNAAGAWFNALPQGDVEQFELIALTADGTFDRAALITPAGTYDFKRQTDGGFAANLSASRRLTVRLHAA